MNEVSSKAMDEGCERALLSSGSSMGMFKPKESTMVTLTVPDTGAEKQDKKLSGSGKFWKSTEHAMVKAFPVHVY